MSAEPHCTTLSLPDPLDVAVFSRGIRRIPHLETFLGARSVKFRPGAAAAGTRVNAVAGWGRKQSAESAQDYACRHGLPFIRLEDGFLRSVGLGHEAPPLSLVLDDVGIYYDARGPSRLELLLEGEEAPRVSDPLLDPSLLARAERLRQLITEAEVSKYNASSTRVPDALRGTDDWVLVVDQTYGDASVTRGLASADSFTNLMEAALDENPGQRILLKVHPDTLAGKKSGYLYRPQLPDRIVALTEPVNPIALLKRVGRAYVCTSQLGFEALLLNKPVTCFGAPFYSGWGLTDDRLPIGRRTRQRSLDELVAAALLLYPRYIHPVSKTSCEAEEVAAHLALQRRRFAENARTFVCVGFSTWKRPFVRQFLQGPDARTHFVRSERQAARCARANDATLVSWATRTPPWLERLGEARSLPVWRMEDGFLRSVRLGSDLSAPASLVLDRAGIYYDPRAASDLELILQDTQFTATDLERARALRQRIVTSRISKYNVGSRTDHPSPSSAHRVLFVPGQVPGDASVLYGSPHAKSDKALLQAVRAAHPGAYVLYKPHPDVVSGNRPGEIPSRGERLWDELVIDAPLHDCLDRAQQVHTMTSLVGFEALLRGIPVVSHGQPFYAGWGLTEDLIPPPRRTRRLQLDELVAGVLLYYPRYHSASAQAFCEPEDAVLELTRERDEAKDTASLRAPWVLRRARSLAALAREWCRAY